MGDARRKLMINDYWEQKRDEIKKLEPFFYVCDVCNGVGATLTKDCRFGKGYESCKKCNCEGKINWLQKVFE